MNNNHNQVMLRMGDIHILITRANITVFSNDGAFLYERDMADEFDELVNMIVDGVALVVSQGSAIENKEDQDEQEDNE